MTLVLSGSPDATPSGKNCRASRQWLRDTAGVFAKAAVAPRAAAVANNALREIFVIGCLAQKLGKEAFPRPRGALQFLTFFGKNKYSTPPTRQVDCDLIPDTAPSRGG